MKYIIDISSLLEQLLSTKESLAKAPDVFVCDGGFVLVIAPTEKYDGNDVVPFDDDALPFVSEPLNETIKISTDGRRRQWKFRDWDVISGGLPCQASAAVHKHTPPKPKEHWELSEKKHKRDNALTEITQEASLYLDSGQQPVNTFQDGTPSLVESRILNNHLFNFYTYNAK